MFCFFIDFRVVFCKEFENREGKSLIEKNEVKIKREK